MYRHEQPPGFGSWQAEARQALDEQIVDFQQLDPIVSQILHGYQAELEESPRAREAFESLARTAHRSYLGRLGEPPPVSGFWYLVRAATVKQLMQDNRSGYDIATFARHPSLWRPYIHDMLTSSERWGELTVDVIARQMSTNRVSRRNSLLGLSLIHI